jgi:Co/Zn/Cd efflux system component
VLAIVGTAAPAGDRSMLMLVAAVLTAVVNVFLALLLRHARQSIRH